MLNNKQREEIRTLYVTTDLSQAQLAQQYGISTSTVSRILVGHKVTRKSCLDTYTESEILNAGVKKNNPKPIIKQKVVKQAVKKPIITEEIVPIKYDRSMSKSDNREQLKKQLEMFRQLREMRKNDI